ncbi:MAG: 30S ribosome-binding factor RbfA [Phenylobacterium sp.]|uniref:30S ribosome-binding factor RbfA n=1 Tax=Phenylobacterium sp. TaxID=1871053 RepID=UPI0025D9DE5E|nr:30S ribosome-binding factor RbfA [Phenylobacterium sp.]MCG9915430.1 30S ribosome-binding factor RbfA [Phenylobacterium sp.]
MKRRPPSRTPAARTPGARSAPRGPSQRQLRAGELVRHALVEILREEDLDDPALSGAPVTITEVRVSPDLRHAICFIQPLGGENAPEVVAAMNRASKFFRGRLGRMIDLRATPELKFLHDETFDAADQMSRLFDDPKVRQDLDAPEED